MMAYVLLPTTNVCTACANSSSVKPPTPWLPAPFAFGDDGLLTYLLTYVHASTRTRMLVYSPRAYERRYTTATTAAADDDECTSYLHDDGGYYRLLLTTTYCSLCTTC